MLIEILLSTILILLIFLIYLVNKKSQVESKDIESALSNIWMKCGIDQKIGQLSVYAENIQNDYRSLEQMLRIPQERGSIGEIALENILTDQLPADMFGIRQKIPDGSIPDAFIKSTVGIICIDSKFPLDNYLKMTENENPDTREGLKKGFLKDVKGHLDKIVRDYVCPEKGTADFAFAFIPSEAVYYFLINESYDLLREYTKKGVQVTSPLTLSHKIELIKAGVHAKKLSEDAEKIRKNILALSNKFDAIDESWRKLSGHLNNASKQQKELEGAYKDLHQEFDRIKRLSNSEI